MKSLYIICYDISSDSKRVKVVDHLEYHGHRKNRSVFECWLSKREKEVLTKELIKFIDKDTDSLLMYKLCKSCLNKKIEYPFIGPERGIGFL